MIKTERLGRGIWKRLTVILSIIPPPKLEIPLTLDGFRRWEMCDDRRPSLSHKKSFVHVKWRGNSGKEYSKPFPQFPRQDFYHNNISLTGHVTVKILQIQSLTFKTIYFWRTVYPTPHDDCLVGLEWKSFTTLIYVSPPPINKIVLLVKHSSVSRTFPTHKLGINCITDETFFSLFESGKSKMACCFDWRENTFSVKIFI